MTGYFIIGYLIVGSILNIVGPVGKDINKAIRDNYNYTNKDEDKNMERVFNTSGAFTVIILRGLLLLFWPIIYFLIFPYDYLFGPKGRYRKFVFRTKPAKRKELKNHWRREGLYFERLGGTGEIICSGCGSKELVVAFLHSFPLDRWNKTGYQCQKCGKFHGIENDNDLDSVPQCECGGLLSTEARLFCPSCKSYNLKFKMKYIT